MGGFGAAGRSSCRGERFPGKVSAEVSVKVRDKVSAEVRLNVPDKVGRGIGQSVGRRIPGRV